MGRTTSTPDAWLVAMSSSSLVVRGLLCPSLWTKDFLVVPDRNAPNDVIVRDIGHMPGEALDILVENFVLLLLAVLEVPWAPWTHVYPQEVPHEDHPVVRPALDLVRWKVFKPCSRRVSLEQWEVVG